MNIYETIKNRRSVRSFDGSPIAREEAEKILEYARKADNPYGIPVEWRLLNAKEHGLNSPVISGSELYIAGKMERKPHAEEAFGYSFERVVLFCEAMGVGTTIIAGTMNRPAFEEAMELKEGEVLPCVSPLGYAAKKLSVREALMRKGIKADSRLPFSELFFDGSFDKPLTEEGAAELRPILDAVRLAPSAVNKQPWRIVLKNGKAHFFEQHSKGFINEKGWDIQRIDMGIALCHFVLACEEAGLKPEFAVESPENPAIAEIAGAKESGCEYIASVAF